MDNSGAEQRWVAQSDYCNNQKKNDKTRKILENYFGTSWADQYINNVLFDGP